MKKQFLNIDSHEAKDFLRKLPEIADLDEVEAGILAFILDNDYDSLSKKQKYRFDQMIERETIGECPDCLDNIPWEYQEFARDHKGRCPDCYEKFHDRS